MGSSATIKFDGVCKASICYIGLLLFRFMLLLMQGEIYRNSVNSLFVQCVLVVFALVIRNSKLSYRIWKTSIVFYAMVIAGVGVWLYITSSLVNSKLFGSAYGNILYIASVFCLIVLSRARSVILIVLSVLIVTLTWFSETRSAFVSEMVMYAVWLLFIKRKYKEKTYYLLFIMMITICFIIPYFYMALFNAAKIGGTLGNISTYLSVFVREKTGANFYSGRQILWPYIIEAMNEKFIFGYGVGFSPSEIYGTTFSAHNLFFFCRLEMGIIGFITFIMVLFNYFKDFYKNRYSTVVGLAFMSSLMLQQTFSLGLLSGKGSFAISCWFAFAILSLQEPHNEMEVVGC